MSVLVAIAITTGILSGIWGWVSVSLGLLTWAGFLGCTTYFASPQDGVKGLALSVATNMSGVFWAMVIIQLSTIAGAEVIGYVITGIVATLMCVQAKQTWLNYIPGTFVGSCATFAAAGDWQAVIPALIVGATFGFLMKASGLWLHQKINQPAAAMETAKAD
ncbi:MULTISPECIES: DUF1097 domain-containing protein [Ferrimonas]|uniref:DUF1097 domain-containing protein n=1 Tax=Ferrimonas TaxID=44011 RepID=UPI0004271217|nr:MULTISPECIES: DUF1097 domain-containing protein [Ferrimonas]USD36173.1 DUF1097 domain-containing protein [Ferrimonas sp. SCSIO 43195]